MKCVWLAVLVCLCGCVSVPTREETEQAEDYLFPKYKFTRERAFPFTQAERRKAIETSRRQRAEILYQLLIDSDGKVTKVEIVRDWADYARDEMGIRFGNHLKRQTFKADYEPGRYRACYYPMQVSVERWDVHED